MKRSQNISVIFHSFTLQIGLLVGSIILGELIQYHSGVRKMSVMTHIKWDIPFPASKCGKLSTISTRSHFSHFLHHNCVIAHIITTKDTCIEDTKILTTWWNLHKMIAFQRTKCSYKETSCLTMLYSSLSS